MIGQGLYIVLATALAPVFNMFTVTEHFVAYNLLDPRAERACQLTAALSLQHADEHHLAARGCVRVRLSGGGPPGRGVRGAGRLADAERSEASPEAVKGGRAGGIRELSRTLGWYLAVELASSLHERVHALVMNAYFALLGNIVFGLALQFTSYVRQATQGVTFGLDAVCGPLQHGQEQVAVGAAHALNARA